MWVGYFLYVSHNTCPTTVCSNNGVHNFRIGYGIDGNVNGRGACQLGNYAVFAFGAGGKIDHHICRCDCMARRQLRPHSHPQGKYNRNTKSPLSDKHTTPTKSPLNKRVVGSSSIQTQNPVAFGASPVV